MNLTRAELQTIQAALAIIRSSVTKAENFWPNIDDVSDKIDNELRAV